MTAINSSNGSSPTGRLRVLATTDLHMQLLDYDYFADRTDRSIGLIGLADHIAALRNDDGVTTLLCDNGDLIQGNPLADHLAARATAYETHPMIAALNLLQYDAMTLGNHEFDYGVDYLRNTLSKAAFAVVSANISCRNGRTLAAPFTVIKRTIRCNDGVSRPIRIGITGFGPPQIADWGDLGRDGTVRVEDIVTAAQNVVPKMRAAGADLIVALCHSGIGAAEHSPRMENAALPLAAVDGIDGLLLGHTHDAFPRAHVASTDHRHGHLHEKPAVMATFCGKALGRIEFDLQWSGSTWAITNSTARLEHPDTLDRPESVLRQKLRAIAAKPHAATLREIRTPIAKTGVLISSYFATVMPDLSQDVLARAMQDALKSSLAGTEHAALPILAATSSYRSGGRSGVGHYIDIPPGPITLRDVAAIFPFADKCCAIRRSGKQIRLWLERAAAHYNQVHPGQMDQPLINADGVNYNCDAIFGLTYQLDLTQPARFDVDGREIDSNARRIVKLAFQGRRISDTDTFIVAANSFRAKGGGSFPAIDEKDILFTSPHSVRDHLKAYLMNTGRFDASVQPTWSFTPIPKTAAVFSSAPQAQDHLTGPIRHIGPGKDGFAQYRIDF